jgi:hypothetical protein
MPACPKTQNCALHPHIGMREALLVWQSFYCDGAFPRCERFKLAAAGVDVPQRLLPNGRLLDDPGAPRAHGGRAA